MTKALLVSLLVFPLVAANPAKVPNGNPPVDPNAPAVDPPAKVKKDKSIPKELRQSEEMRTLLGVKEEAEWKILYGRIQRVQALAGYAKDLRDHKKSLAPPKPPKDKALDVPPPAPPAYLMDVAIHAAELRTAWNNPDVVADDIKQRLVAYRKARGAAETQLAAELGKARAELRELLTARQELALTVNGVLD